MHETFGSALSPSRRRAHSVVSPSRTGGFASVVEHEAHVRMPARGLDRRRQLGGANEEVVHEPRLADRCDPTLDVGAQEPFGVGLVVHLMPDPDERAAAETLRTTPRRRR